MVKVCSAAGCHVRDDKKLDTCYSLHIVLVFPPFSPRCRFLVHKVIEEYFPSFCSFSIGQDDCRRLIVCSFEFSQRSARPHNCIHRKLAYLSADDKPVTCSCNTRRSVMSSSVPMEQSSEKYDRKSPRSDTRRKSNISLKETHDAAELPSQTKCSRMKQKRPDMPLYIPRARRLQEESEAQCANRHKSPGRQKGKRSSAQPLEAQSKRLPKSTMIKTDKADPPPHSSSGSEDFVEDKTPGKNVSSVVLEKLLPQSKNIVIEQHVNDRAADVKSTGTMSSSSLLEKDCLSLGNTSIKDSTRIAAHLSEISNNSCVKPNSKSTVEVQLKHLDHEAFTNSCGVAFSDSVPVISNAEVVSSKSGKADSQDVSELSIESSVPFACDENEEMSGVQDSTSHPALRDQSIVFTCPEERMPSESTSINVRVETGAITVQNNLSKSSDESASQCSLVTSVSDHKKNSDFDCVMDNLSSLVTPPQVEIIISEKNTVIENLSDGADSVQIVTLEKIDCLTSSKDKCDSEDESDKYCLNMQNDMDSACVEEMGNSPIPNCPDADKSTESSNAFVSSTDFADAPMSVDTPNELCVSSLSVQSEITAPSKIDSDGLELSKAMEVCEEKVSIGSKVLSDNGGSAVEVESWDSMFDDDGECLNPKVLRELIAAVGDVQIKTSKKDYTEYKPLESTVDEEYGNIIEIYGFPIEFQTQDLVSAFSCFKTHDFTIKWVDDCHALGIFSGAFAATEALTLQHPYVKVRPLSQGIKESKLKAKRYAEHLLPCKPRPATSATLARRLVTGALGLKSNVSKEQRETERLAIKQARDRKRQVAKQRQDIWNGIVS